MGKRGPKPMKDVVVIRGLSLPGKTARAIAKHARTMKTASGKRATRMAAIRDLIGRGLADAESEFG
jgi:hypothetical protein